MSRIKTHTPINRATLKENGWISEGYYNNREFFSKGGYVILEHNCTYGPPATKYALCISRPMKSIEELEKAAYKHYSGRVKSLTAQLKKAEENLKLFKNYE